MKKIFSRSIIILMVITIFTTSIGQNVNLAYANTNNNDSKICIESPTNSGVVKGIIKIEGYVLSDFDPSILGFLNCNVNVDGINQNDTLFKLKTAIQRDDLKKLFPSYTYAGWI